MSALVVAHVLSSFLIGGQEHVALDLARVMVRRGHRVLAVSLAPPPEGALAIEFAAIGAEVHTIAKRPGLDTTLPLRLARAFRRARVDVVHTHNPQPLVYGAPAGRLAGAVVVHTKHGRNPASLAVRALRRAAATCVDAYVAVSHATAEVARAAHDCAPSKIHVIANGIDLAAFGADPTARAEVRRELGIPSDAWVFGTVGRMSKEKDHLRLVAAARPLLDETTWLAVCGDGDQRSAVRAAAEGAPHVVLAGMRRDVPRVLAAFDAFVLSSRTEGMPLALIEAMATGLPVIATDVGGVRDVVGPAAILIDGAGPEPLTAAMRALRGDRERAAELSASALARAESYDAARMTDEYLALYRAVSAQRVRSRHARSSARAANREGTRDARAAS
jgi:glycosyltransferase involved in cell wall biosynthesis